MSRIGRKPIVVPSNVKANLQGRLIKVEGPKGKLEMTHHQRVKVKVEGADITVERSTDLPADRALHGLTRSLINNMVKGVVDGFTKELDIVGVGLRAALKGKVLALSLGFSHPVELAIPDGVEVKVPKPEKILISGIDKQLVGQVAANIRALKKPEPYKGKGIKYVDEVIRRKQGKAVG